jgi:D-glycero-alpha-D-manno-heptose 1-phosphate guanylyltransferase
MTSAVVLAGGLGTRLRSEVPDLPKPMAPVAGRPFLEHLLDYWIAEGIDRFVLSVGFRCDSISGHFGHAYRGARIDYAVETTPLGTGGGLLIAAAMLAADEAFVLLNGDTFFEVRLRALLDFHAGRHAGWTIALFRAAEGGRYMGVETGAEGRIASLNSGSSRPGSLANGGVYCVDAGTLRPYRTEPVARTSLEDQLLPGVIAAGVGVFGIECGGRFIDIGVPHDYRRAATLLPRSSE